MPTDILDWTSLYNHLRYDDRPIYRCLWENLQPDTRRLWIEYESTQLRREELRQRLLDDFNTLIRGPSLWTPARFATKPLSLTTRRALDRQRITGSSAATLNRMLLEDSLSEVHRRFTLPRTLEDAVEQIIAQMDEKDKAEIRSKQKTELVQYHHGWGTSIRNAYGLWGGNNELLSSCGTDFADNASMIIIETVWEKLRASAP